MCKEKAINNIYREGSKFIARKIRRCICSERRGDSYFLDCAIKERGDHLYRYEEGWDFITRTVYDKKLWLSEEALQCVTSAVRDFDETVEAAGAGIFRTMAIEPYEAKIFYDHQSDDLFDFVIKYTDSDCPEDEREFIKLFRNSGVDDMLHFLVFHVKEGDAGISFSEDDELMVRLIKLHCGACDASDCKWLSENVFHVDILPPLSKEYDRSFIVAKESIDRELLRKSGYRIFHRPYFSMYGSTHDKWELNPYTKTGIDAAPKDHDPITFECFARMIFDAVQ